MTRQMHPKEAVDRYLNERKPEVAASTFQNHTYALRQFVAWCAEEELEDIGDLDGFHIHDFKLHRRAHGGVNEVTLYNNLCTLRVFIRWCESVGLVEAGIAEAIILPEPENDARDVFIDVDTAETILSYLARFEYATRRHILFALLWDTGMRLGSIHALDVGDYHPDEQYLDAQHRPETDTPLKNKQRGEREVNLHGWVCDVIDDYVAMHRHDVTDAHGREPLLTTKFGRPAKTGLREHINNLTRPCHYTGECPHERDIETCEAQAWEYAQRCPSSVSPHAIRRSAITHWLNQGHRKELISDRMNVSAKTLDKHYDARTESEKRQLRREAFRME